MWIRLVNAYRWLHRRIAREEEDRWYDLFAIILNQNFDIIEKHLNYHGFYYNDLSVPYVNQLGTWRKRVGQDHQIHIRLYANRVTGHFELATEHPTDHLRGVDYRHLTREETHEIRGIFAELGM